MSTEMDVWLLQKQVREMTRSLAVLAETVTTLSAQVLRLGQCTECADSGELVGAYHECCRERTEAEAKLAQATEALAIIAHGPMESEIPLETAARLIKTARTVLDAGGDGWPCRNCDDDSCEGCEP